MLYTESLVFTWSLHFDKNRCVFVVNASETPLTAAAIKDERSDVIIALVNGGAHLDFRAKDSQTALHRAAAAGKVFSVKVNL